MRTAVDRDRPVAVVIVVGHQHGPWELLNLESALIVDARHAFLEAAADRIEILELRWAGVLLMQKRRERRGPGLVGDLSINRIDDWTPDHRPLTADGGVPGAFRLG